MDEMGVYIVSFDRAGYGESDLNPKWSVRSEAFDIQELADQLKLGPRFYIIGMSLGTYPLPSGGFSQIFTFSILFCLNFSSCLWVRLISLKFDSFRSDRVKI